MKFAAILLVAATAASAAVREPEITMTARRIMNSLQINAMVVKGYKFPPGNINLIQVGSAIPERPISMTSREITWQIQPIPKTWTVGVVLTDKNRSRVWQSYYKGSLAPNSENAIVEVVDAGPVIPESGIIQRPPVLPPLSDVKDADMLPAAVKSQNGGKWRERSGANTGGPGLSDSPYGTGAFGNSSRKSGNTAAPAAAATAPAAAPAPAPEAEAAPAVAPAAPVAAAPVTTASPAPAIITPAAPVAPAAPRSDRTRSLIDSIRNRK